jgi:hypothetical protein
MRIKSIRDQIRNDIFGTLECEHCGAEEKFVGYDDDNYHDNVIPARKCKVCGRASQQAA